MKHIFAYPDTSFLIPLFIQETGTAVSKRIVMEFTKGGELPLIISELTCVEFASTVSKYVRMGSLAKEIAKQVLTTFDRRCAKEFIVIPMQSKMYSAAYGYLARMDTPLRALDALHLAVAHINKCTLITADKRFAIAAATLDIEYCFVPYS